MTSSSVYRWSLCFSIMQLAVPRMPFKASTLSNTPVPARASTNTSSLRCCHFVVKKIVQ